MHMWLQFVRIHSTNSKSLSSCVSPLKLSASNSSIAQRSLHFRFRLATLFRAYSSHKCLLWPQGIIRFVRIITVQISQRQNGSCAGERARWKVIKKGSECGWKPLHFCTLDSRCARKSYVLGGCERTRFGVVLRNDIHCYTEYLYTATNKIFI